MTCPRCEVSSLEERAQGGVVVDVCTGCRGVWLDRGELDKLLARAHRHEHDHDDDDDEVDLFGGRARRYRRPDTDDGDRERDHDRERTFDGHAPHGAHAPRKKRRWFDALGEIFD